jgi:ribosomal protein S18 acetylase RimI-like enzyme
MQWVYDDHNIDWDALSTLYKIAPLGKKDPQKLKIAFDNSMYKCFVYDNEKLVGAGRALADGIDTSYICDVAIHPKYQGQGLGKAIMQYLMQESKGHRKMILYANLGKEPFYAKLGFAKMNTAMAIFENQEQMIAWGMLSNED